MTDMYAANQSALASQHTHILSAFDAAALAAPLDFGDHEPGRYHAEVFINGDTRSVKVKDRPGRCSVTAYRSTATLQTPPMHSPPTSARWPRRPWPCLTRAWLSRRQPRGSDDKTSRPAGHARGGAKPHFSHRMRRDGWPGNRDA